MGSPLCYWQTDVDTNSRRQYAMPDPAIPAFPAAVSSYRSVPAWPFGLQQKLEVIQQEASAGRSSKDKQVSQGACFSFRSMHGL